VIGSGPAGQKAAVQGAKLRKRVAIIERRHMVGGVCVNTGTIPSKTLREAVVYLTGMSLREVYGSSYRVKADITIADLGHRTQHVIAREVDVIRDQLQRNHIDLVSGTARFVDANTLALRLDSGDERQISAERIVITVGTKPTRPRDVEFDDETVIDSDGLLGMKRIPSSLVVVGAGVIGIEYASMLAALGTKVTVVEQRAGMLEFCDDEIVEGLQHQLRERGLVFRFGETVTKVELHDGGSVTTSQAASGSPPTPCSIPPGGREQPTRLASTTPDSKPTSAVGSRSMSTTARRCRTSMPSAT
jgi:NAD(P) transhydrogenase